MVFGNNDVPGIGGCDRNGVTADYNVFYDTTTGTCGPHDLLASGFVGSTDPHLVAGAAAIDHGSSNATQLDRDEFARDATPDIGAYEWHP